MLSIGHTTVCVSSQVGCSRDCTFCATGTMGLLQQLTAAEILEQLWHAHVTLSKMGPKKVLVSSHSSAASDCSNSSNSVSSKSSSSNSSGSVTYREVPRKIRNVVFMGMGEPLDNYNSVLSALRGMHENAAFDLSYQHITISTVGIVNRIKQLAVDCPQVDLALSLHAPSQDIRKQIVPSAESYSVRGRGRSFMIDTIRNSSVHTHLLMLCELLCPSRWAS